MPNASIFARPKKPKRMKVHHNPHPKQAKRGSAARSVGAKAVTRVVVKRGRGR